MATFFLQLRHGEESRLIYILPSSIIPISNPPREAAEGYQDRDKSNMDWTGELQLWTLEPVRLLGLTHPSSVALAAAAINVTLTMIAISRLQKRRIQINWMLVKLFMPEYMNEYKKLIIAETGRVDRLFIDWLVSINAAWIFFPIGLILRWIN